MDRPRITFVSTGRADFGAISAVLRVAGERLQPQLVLCGDAEVLQAETAGWETLVVGGLAEVDSGRDASLRVAQVTRALAAEFGENPPDIVLVAGDRYELLGVLGAVIPSGIPLAHISGGEITEGAFDEQVRHAVTKAAHVHFVANPVFASRLHRMGEEAGRVHVTGDPGLDGIARLDLADTAALGARLNLPIGRDLVLVAYHPVTNEPESTWREWAAIQAALEDHAGPVVVTGSNRDPQSARLRALQQAWCPGRPSRRYVEHLGQRNFLTLLALGGCLIGNSSSGIWEAPSLGAPAINLGHRQQGRLRGANVIDVPEPEAAPLGDALRRALDPAFRAQASALPNPYGDGKSAPRIVEVLAALPPRARLLHKRFNDSP